MAQLFKMWKAYVIQLPPSTPCSFLVNHLILLLLRDVVDYATLSIVPVAILSLDQEKAFDWVEWPFMHQTLLAMGFGHSFVNWVDLFYGNVRGAVNVNGYLSPFFSLSHGVCQGCPLSSLLYVLVSQVLAVNIVQTLEYLATLSLVFHRLFLASLSKQMTPPST